MRGISDNVASKRVTAILAALTVMLGVVSGEKATAQSAETVSVAVEATGAPADTSAVYICLWSSSRSFPIRSNEAAHFRRATKSGSSWRARFTGVTRGTYAITGFADMDGDGEIDRNFIGRPRELVGISIDGRVSGRSSFRSASLNISSDFQYRLVLRQY